MKILIPLLFFGGMVGAQTIPVNTNAKKLDKNKVKASIYTVNNRFWNVHSTQNAAYEVPVGKGTHAHFANSIWIGGLDNNNLLHVAANSYRQMGADYWPGPLDTTNIGLYNAPLTANYNKLWKVDCDEIKEFVNAFSNGWVANNTYTVPADILTYPAKGQGNFQRNLTPFKDVNNNGSYNPAAEGDYPIIKGHQQILSIFNDTLGRHGESKGAAMGLEIHERSYAYTDPNIHDTMQAINYTTFYHYTIINRSANNYYNVYLTNWSDADVGNHTDDYFGTDSVNSFMYWYNAAATDPNIPNINPFAPGIKGYGNKPPVLSEALIDTDNEHDGVDNNHDGRIDEAGEHFLLDRSTFYNRNNGTVPLATTHPSLAPQFYGYMTGYWKDNTPHTFAGNAYGGLNPAQYMFAGNPATNWGWTESTSGSSGDLQMILATSGPFNFPAGARIEWSYAVVFSQDTTQAVNTITQFDTRVKRDVRNIRYYDATHQAPQCTPALTTGMSHLKSATLDALVYPNPASDHLEIQLLNKSEQTSVKLFDCTGRIVVQGTINGTDRVSLDLAGVKAGAYLLEINENNNRLYKKVLKD